LRKLQTPSVSGVCLLVSVLVAQTMADTSKGIRAYQAGDYATALKEFMPSAALGDKVAQFSVGVLYYYGRGVQQNHDEARRWYRLAADQGYGRAQVNLGMMWGRGEGGPRDYVEAFMWFSLAAAAGDEQGRQGRDALAPRMTPAQLAEGRKRALEWEPKE